MKKGLGKYMNEPKIISITNQFIMQSGISLSVLNNYMYHSSCKTHILKDGSNIDFSDVSHQLIAEVFSSDFINEHFSLRSVSTGSLSSSTLSTTSWMPWEAQCLKGYTCFWSVSNTILSILPLLNIRFKKTSCVYMSSWDKHKKISHSGFFSSR